MALSVHFLKLLLQLKKKSAICLDSFIKQKLFNKAINFIAVAENKIDPPQGYYLRNRNLLLVDLFSPKLTQVQITAVLNGFILLMNITLN